MRRAVDASASWIDYDVARCVSPPRPTPPPALVALGVNASRDCHLTISNDGHRFDDQSWLGGEGGEGGEGGASPWVTRMGNAASVPFRYDDRVPVPTSAESSHAADALRHQLGFASRGPFAGGTEVTIRGDGFLRGDALACRFEEEGDGETAKRPLIPSSRRPARDSSTREPSFASRRPDIRDRGRRRTPRRWRRVSPPRYRSPTTARRGPEPANAVRHLYCDVYVHPAARHVNPERAFGTPDRPFPNLQAAFSATLRDARLFRRANTTNTRASRIQMIEDTPHARVAPHPGFDRSASRRVARTPPRAARTKGASARGRTSTSCASRPARTAASATFDSPSPTGRSFASSPGTDSGTNPTRSSRGANANARRSIVARRDTPRRCSRRRASDSAKPRRFPGRTGDSSGGAVVTASRITFLGCFHADGEHEAVADGGARRTRTGRSRGRRSRREARGDVAATITSRSAPRRGTRARGNSSTTTTRRERSRTSGTSTNREREWTGEDARGEDEAARGEDAESSRTRCTSGYGVYESRTLEGGTVSYTRFTSVYVAYPVYIVSHHHHTSRGWRRHAP